MYLGIDIGGTKTLLALFNSQGEIIAQARFATPQNQELFLPLLQDHLVQLPTPPLAAIAVPIAGQVLPSQAILYGNLPWNQDFLTQNLKKLFNSPLFFINDADCAALYEAQDFVGCTIYLTFSTGIGGGIIVDGQLAPSSATFEPGHQLYLYHNQTLEWEDIAAASVFTKLYGTRVTETTWTFKRLQDLVIRLSLGLCDIIENYRPNRLIIGGALGFIYPLFITQLSQLLQSQFDTPPKLLPARRPTDSTIYGAYTYLKTRGF